MLKRSYGARLVGVAAALVAASGLIRVSAADDEKKHKLEIIANCPSREAPAFFSEGGAPEKSIKWNADRTAADVVITRAATVLATYRVAESTKSVEVSYQEHEFPDQATNERHSRMVNRCLFEAGYDNILINKKD